MNLLEMGLPAGVEILRFTYKGKVRQVPVAPNFLYLKKAIHAAVVPELDKRIQAQRPGQIVGVGFVKYYYATDDFAFTNPEATQALSEHMKAAGLPVADEPKKLDPIAPQKWSLISDMRQTGDAYLPLRGFEEGTFIIGPIVIKPIRRHPGFYYPTEEVKAARLITDKSIAVHGETLLADIALPKGRDRIFNEETIAILERVFRPYPLL